MYRLFVHNPWFRLLGPLFSGILVYLLILLINDAVLYIQEDFLSQELFVCIGLAYLTQEFSRLSLLAFERLNWSKSFVCRIFFQIITSMALTIILVTTAIYLYFDNVLLYQPSPRELFVFNSIFSFITLLYVVLYLGHYFLFRRNTQKLKMETQVKQAVEGDFNTYLKGINPELLFESLEALLVTMKEDPNKAEALSDYFSTVYRYILSKRKRELVPIQEELHITKALIQLFNHLPHRKVRLGKIALKDGHILPTSLLTIVEQMVRTTIATKKNSLVLSILERPETFEISYTHEEKLKESLNLEALQDISRGYQFYTEVPLQIYTEDSLKIIQLPKLSYHESSHT